MVETREDNAMRALKSWVVHPPLGKYSQGIAAPAGQIVVTSGQLGIDADSYIPEDVYEQSNLCLTAIHAILAEANCDLKNIIRLNAYVTDREHMADYMRARDEWFADIDPKPASTLMIVSGFTREEFLVEVEALAVGGSPT